MNGTLLIVMLIAIGLAWLTYSAVSKRRGDMPVVKAIGVFAVTILVLPIVLDQIAYAFFEPAEEQVLPLEG